MTSTMLIGTTQVFLFGGSTKINWHLLESMAPHLRYHLMAPHLYMCVRYRAVRSICTYAYLQLNFDNRYTLCKIIWAHQFH